MDLSKKVFHFLKKHWDGHSPLLLGYSGGPDSKALLYALLKAGVRPDLGHIDHGWREESGSEAGVLEQEAKALGLIFHTTRLSNKPEKNLEEAGRIARLAFFEGLFAKTPYQALLLAHHSDDLAETSLKRVLEGAHLSHIGGMRPVSKLGDIPIWRPLLSVTKQQIRTFLEEKNLAAIEDPTNQDPRYLRSRLREEILPTLTATFGKEIRNNLVLLSERAIELREYLDRRVEAAWIQRKEGGEGTTVTTDGLEKIEIRHLLQKIASREGVILPRAMLERLVEALWKRERKQRLFVKSREFFADQGYVTVSVRRFLHPTETN